MGKKIKISIKDKDNLEFTLDEDAKQGDFICLKDFLNIDMSPLTNFINEQIQKQKTTIEQQYQQAFATKLKNQAINEFKNSNDYLDLKATINQQEKEILNLTNQNKTAVETYKSSKEYQELLQQLGELKAKTKFLNEQIEKNKKDLPQIQTNAINNFKQSDEYLDLIHEKEALQKLTLEQKAQIANNEALIKEKVNGAINAFKLTDENYLETKKQVETQKQEIVNIKNQLEQKSLELRSLQEKQQLEKELYLSQKKDEIITNYKKSEEFNNLEKQLTIYKKELEGRQLALRNSKTLGEELENWIFNEYQRTFGLAFNDAIFEKTTKNNEENEKPDFAFKVYDKPTTENDKKTLIGSVIIEAKTKFNNGESKKNHDFYNKLNRNKLALKGDYAILVSELEPENAEIYVVNEYDNMFVVQPHWLMPLLSLLHLILVKKYQIQALNVQMKEKQALLNEFDELKTNILSNSFKNIQTNLKGIKDSANSIQKSALKISNQIDTIIDTHMNTIRKKLNDFNLLKKLEKIEKLETKSKELLNTKTTSEENIIINLESKESNN